MAFFSKSKSKREQTSFATKMGFGNIDRNVRKNEKKEKDARAATKALDDAFAYVQRELPQYVLDQNAYLRDLVIAFKRPYMLPSNKSYRNLIFVFGPEGSGRKYSIQVIAKMLSIQKVLKASSIYRLDFSNYSTEESTEKLLLPDLYKAFYGQSPVVLFDNFDAASTKALGYITTLGKEGVLAVDKRYIWKNAQLQDATGSYAMGSGDSLSANGKYIVLISTKRPDCMEQLFPKVFLDEIPDVLTTKPISENALVEICESFLDDCKDSLYKHTGISIQYDASFVQALASMPLRHGVHDLERCIRQNIYEALVELQLRKKLSHSNTTRLRIQDNEIYAGKALLSTIEQGVDEQVLRRADEELDAVIGLNSVKEFVRKLRDYAEFESRKRTDTQGNPISMHMIFCGNPGTGKTTIARIVAKYLKGLGLLSSGHLVEVTREDLVAQYVGQTAPKTAQMIQSALGGVLFIDEAYSLAGGTHDTFGMEAVNTLVKYMEDYRQDLVVILAGYTNEMQEFLKLNSGLRSRFPHTIEFPDYTPEELCQIAEAMARNSDYRIEDACKPLLVQFFVKKQIPGKNDAGNGRMVRNTVEAAIANHSHRLASLSEGQAKEQKSLLTTEDFGLKPDDSFDLEAELQNVVGLENVKKLLRDLQLQLMVDKRRREAGIDIDTRQSLNMVFIGNPGTGKTYIARTVARILKQMDILKSGQLVETDRSGLVAQYVGQTAQKVRECFMSALGGVLFIDEAYSLSSSNAFDREAIDTLIKLIEDYAGEIVVIVAGYKKEMGEFMANNSGLRSRFNITMEFPDYSIEELLQILRTQAQSKGFTIDADACAVARSLFERELRASEYPGNGRMVRNILEEAIRRQTRRIAQEERYDSKEELVLLKAEDFSDAEKGEKPAFDLEAELSQITGLGSVKQYLRSLYASLTVAQARREMGIDSEFAQTLHMVFTGNPGTGKTTVARITGKLLNAMGILSSDNFVETDRAGLVAGYVGQTALKTKAVIQSALDGVLFIDEAYALSSDAATGGFGKEAINTLVKDMDDHRDRLVVILAGYSEDMRAFLEANPGLSSRFPNTIDFPDYSPEELLEIIRGMYTARHYVLGPGAEEKLLAIFAASRVLPHFGNGRFARNLCEKSIRNQSMRITKTGRFTKDDLMTICTDDLENV